MIRHEAKRCCSAYSAKHCLWDPVGPSRLQILWREAAQKWPTVRTPVDMPNCVLAVWSGSDSCAFSPLHSPLHTCLARTDKMNTDVNTLAWCRSQCESRDYSRWVESRNFLLFPAKLSEIHTGNQMPSMLNISMGSKKALRLPTQARQLATVRWSALCNMSWQPLSRNGLISWLLAFLAVVCLPLACAGCSANWETVHLC